MGEVNIKKAYESLGEKLPQYEELNKEFDLESIDSEKNILREVAKRVANKHEHYAGIIENIIHPDPTITAMHESQAFNDVERTQLGELLRKLMSTYRAFTLIDLEKEGFVAFVNTSWSQWSGLKKELRVVLQQLKNSWEKNNDLRAEIEYLG